jgi:predicted flap endonuclease-1-like 5' DNA nuclease
MTYLLLQTFLLLLASYFCGAFVACLAKQLVRGQRRAPAHSGQQWDDRRQYDEQTVPLIPIQSSVAGNMAASTAVAAAAAAAAATRAPRDMPRIESTNQSRARATSAARETVAPPRSLVPSRPRTPRVIEPVQPKIDVVPRPAPRPAPPIADVGRFDRALTGPELNAGMPRIALVELRPAVLKFATGPALPWVPPPKLIAAPVEASAQPDADVAVPVGEQLFPEKVEPAADVVDKEKLPIAKPRRSVALTASITQAATAAVAAAKSAVAALAPVKKVEPDIAQSGSDLDRGETDKSDAPAEETSKAAQEKSNEKPADDGKIVKVPGPARPAEPTHSQVLSEPAAEKDPPVSAPPAPQKTKSVPKPVVANANTPEALEGGDDLQRIRAITPEVEQGLKSLGMMRFEDIARWTLAEISVIDEMLELSGRIDREQWIEQAQILAKGGETYYSRNRAAAAKRVTPDKPTTLPSASVDQGNEKRNADNGVPPSGAASSEPSTNVKDDDSRSEPLANTDVSEPASVAPQAQGKSVSEIAAAAAAAIAAASASVTRGRRPVEQISPLSKADPNVVMPTKLSAAIKERVAKDTSETTTPFDVQARTEPDGSSDDGDDEPGGDDLKRIRGIGVLIEKRLKSLGVTTYDHIANWTSGDIDRVSQTLDFKGRVERENWVEQARILSSGGQTEFSRRVDRGDVESSRE